MAELIASGAITFAPIGPSNGESQTVNWTYNPTAADLDWLREGDTLTITYVAQIDDGHGNVGAQDLVITITGTNDAPVIESATYPASIGESAGDSSAQDIATVTGTITVTDQDLGDTLTLSVTGNATAQYNGGAVPTENSVDIAALLASGAIHFAALTSDGETQTINWTYDPEAADLDWLRQGDTLTITYVAQVDDGQGNVGAQDLVITITGTNDAPVVTAGGMLNYTENAAATVVDAGFTVADVDDMNIEGATVQITGGYQNGEDFLAFATQNGISGVFDSASGTLTLSGSATLADYQSALRSVTYENTSDDPDTSQRTVTTILNDGDDNSTSATSTINVTAVNDAPEISGIVSQGVEFANIADYNVPNSPGNGGFNSAYSGLPSNQSDGRAITGFEAGDTVVFSVTPSGGGWYFTLYDGANNVLASIDSATLTSGVQEEISYTVTGGDDTTLRWHLGPAYSGNPSYSVSATATSAGLVTDEDQSAVFPAIALTDADAGTDPLSVSLGVGHGELSFNGATTGLTFTDADGSDGTLAFYGSQDDINAALTTFQYTPDADFNGDDALSITVNDQGSSGGAAQETTGTLSITVNPVNDAPTDLTLSNDIVGRNLADITVGLVSSQDPDTGATVTYSIQPGLDADLFVLEGNQLKVGSSGIGSSDGNELQVTVRATDQFGAYTDQTFSIHVEDRAVFSLTLGPDTPEIPVEGAYVVGTASTLNSSDTLTGDAGPDSLLLYNSGTFRLDQVAGFTGFEEVQLINFTGTADLYLRDGVDIEVNGGGSGSKGYYLGTGAETITGGSGTDRFYVTKAGALTVGDHLDGGASTDQLFIQNLPSGSTVDIRGVDLTSIESLFVYAPNATILVDQASLASFTNLNSNQNAQLVTDETSLDLTGMNVSGITIASSNATGTTFTTDNANTVSQIVGGPGNDTLVYIGVLTDDQKNEIFAGGGIETVTDNNGSVVSPFDASVQFLSAGTDPITLPAAGGQVVGVASTLNSGDTLTGDVGTDILSLYGAGTFRLDQVAGFTGFEEIQLINSTGTADLYLRDGVDIEVNGGGDGTKGYYLGTGAETITGGSGSDRFYITKAGALTVGDHLDGGASNDYLFIQNLPSGSTVDIRGADLTSIENLFVYAPNTTILVDQASLASFTNLNSNQNAQLVTDETSLDLTGMNVSGITIASSNATGTTFTTDNANTVSQIVGGPGGRYARLQRCTHRDQRDEIFAEGGIDIIHDDTGIYGDADGNTLLGTAAADSSSAATVRTFSSAATVQTS